MQLNAVTHKPTNTLKTMKITNIAQSLMHRRLGHRSISTIMIAHEDGIWNDVNIIRDPEVPNHQSTQNKPRKTNNGNNSLDEHEDIM
jgi:hypothetical protein